jgi:ferrochelatase
MSWFQGPRGAPAQTGVLLMNLGTPERPDYWPIRRFLGAFLSDRRVVEACPAYWYPLLYGPILAFRPLRTRHLYRRIWMPEGSPLRVYSQRLARALAASLGAEARVALAMTYGKPSPRSALADLGAIRRLVVLPLYPQYSGTTTGAAFDALARVLEGLRVVPEIEFVADYHDAPRYIAALADSVRAAWAAAGVRTHLVCSFHGIPLAYHEAGDPYRSQAERTGALLAQALALAEGDFSITYQSRFGARRWLAPSTDERLVELARSGTRGVSVVTPAFAVDCLETLEEIAIRSRARFIAAGGATFTLVPALNDSASHVALLADLVRSRANRTQPSA